MMIEPRDMIEAGPCAGQSRAMHDRLKVSYEQRYRCPVCEIPAYEAAMTAAGRGLSAEGRWRDCPEGDPAVVAQVGRVIEAAE